jgi:hypothetical protein
MSLELLAMRNSPVAHEGTKNTKVVRKAYHNSQDD